VLSGAAYNVRAAFPSGAEQQLKIQRKYAEVKVRIG
jgi:hypothetical protein